MVARAEESQRGATSGAAETWVCIAVTRGIELHLRDDLPKLKAAELKSVLARVETALRRHSR